ncbi:MAG TPA: hypothetical protein VKD47_08900 [Miltoncostaeaceae bacterium]|nr:hypothetical protein [Miltoncostaeaceae bacterium]
MRERADGRACEVCQRTLLPGEPFTFFDDPERRRFRRPVCPLCQRRAVARGWQRTGERPPGEGQPAA